MKNVKLNTKKQRIQYKIDALRKNSKWITWDMIDVFPYWIDKKRCVFYKRLSYEGQVVFNYMKALDIPYIRYSDKYSDRKMHGNNKGFYNDIAKRRMKKIQQINKNMKN